MLCTIVLTLSSRGSRPGVCQCSLPAASSLIVSRPTTSQILFSFHDHFCFSLSNLVRASRLLHRWQTLAVLLRPSPTLPVAAALARRRSPVLVRSSRPRAASVAVAVAHRDCRSPSVQSSLLRLAPGTSHLAPRSLHLAPPRRHNLGPAPRFFLQGTIASPTTQQHLKTTTTAPRHPFWTAVPFVRLIFSLAADFWPAFCPAPLLAPTWYAVRPPTHLRPENLAHSPAHHP